MGDRFGRFGGALFLMGIVFGFVTAIVADLDLTQAWLVIGYVLALFIFVNAFVYHVPNDAKLNAAADASPDDQPSEQLYALVEAPSGRVINVIDGVVARHHLRDGDEALQLTLTGHRTLDPPGGVFVISMPTGCSFVCSACAPDVEGLAAPARGHRPSRLAAYEESGRVY